jgi:UDP-N-acetylglucosamine--N-acetylmuramyl-(pentapeptide) pyrophosphoryl-undecaprenol N-acetylglucosamine transferase
MRLLISGGGTGGHVYPALAVLNSEFGFRSSKSEIECLWVGSVGGIDEDLVRRAGVPFAGIPAGGLRGLAPWTVARNLARLAAGYIQAERLIDDFRPDVVLATGGYVGVPVVLAARWRRVPGLLYLPDIEPGLAIRFLARIVDCIAVSFETSRAYLPAQKVVVTGYPVRPELLHADKATARARLGVSPDAPVLLVFGGSRGARRINQAAAEVMADLAGLAQVIHVTGTLDAAWVQARQAALPAEARRRYRAYPYLHAEMVDALASADLAVARAGAATLGELPAVGLPSILVPYPYSGQHQWPNARYLAERGAAVIVPDAELTGARLLAEVRALLTDPGQLAMMSTAARRLAVPDAAAKIATELRRLARA